VSLSGRSHSRSPKIICPEIPVRLGVRPRKAETLVKRHQRYSSNTLTEVFTGNLVCGVWDPHERQNVSNRERDGDLGLSPRAVEDVLRGFRAGRVRLRVQRQIVREVVAIAFVSCQLESSIDPGPGRVRTIHPDLEFSIRIDDGFARVERKLDGVFALVFVGAPQVRNKFQGIGIWSCQAPMSNPFGLGEDGVNSSEGLGLVNLELNSEIYSRVDQQVTLAGIR